MYGIKIALYKFKQTVMLSLCETFKPKTNETNGCICSLDKLTDIAMAFTMVIVSFSYIQIKIN